MREAARHTDEIPTLGFVAEVPDASVLVASDPLWPLDSTVDRHGVVRIEARAPVDPAAIAAIAHWFGALGPHSGGHREAHPGAAGAPERLHQDFPGGRRGAYSVLHVRELPHALSMTFVDLRRVCADLPTTLGAWVAELQQAPGRPLRASHPRTAHPILLPPPRRGGTIEGLPDAQAASLIEEIWSFIDVSPHRIELELRSNDLMVWDGLAVAYASPPLLHAKGVCFLVAPLDPRVTLVRTDAL